MTMKLDEAMLAGVLAGCKTPEDVVSVYSQMLQRLINRSLEGEMDAHLGYARHAKEPAEQRGNTRNGGMSTTLKGTFGEIAVTTPRDCAGTFEPQLVKKRQTQLGDFEDKILALYTRGMSTRDIESALVDLYGVDISHDVIARV